MINQILYLILAISAVDLAIEMKIGKPNTSDYFCALIMFLLYLAIVWISKKSIATKIKIYSISHRVLNYYHTFNVILPLLIIAIMFIQISYFNVLSFLVDIEIIGQFKILYRILGICLFFLYQSITWYHFSAISNILHNTNFSKIRFVEHNLRIYFPLVIPWLFVVTIEEALNSWTSFVPEWILSYHWVILLSMMLIFFLLFPPVILKIWGCKKITDGRLSFLKEFLESERFLFRGIYLWPIYQGKLYTAGIIGPLPWLRYILITESLLNILNPTELKAVMAHELAHARLKHMWLYLVILLVFMGLLYNSYEVLLYFIIKISFIIGISVDEQIFGKIEYASMSFMIILIFCFLRYIFGYFMRNFERQADLYGASIIGVRPLIDALEKIAYFSGNIRDVPSWHHFSIKERVEALTAFEKNVGFLKNHNKKIFFALSMYILISTVFSLITFKLDIDKLTLITLYENIITQKLSESPKDEELLLALAQISLEKKDVQRAKGIYEKILNVNPNQHVALNNLAWILVTEKDFLDPQRALSLAKRAVELQKNPAYLDTLAEAYLLEGNLEKALELELEAIELASDEKERALFRKKYQALLSRKEINKNLKGP